MTNRNSTLSIAIPTYNFGHFLPNTLESILPQASDHGIEVLILDGCSTDNTQSLVLSYNNNYPNLRYIKALSKGGIDLDMSQSLSNTSSEYCWLFSADDICNTDSVAYLLSVIEHYSPDLILCRHNECDINMNIIKPWPVIDINEERIYNLNEPKQQAEYYNSALSSEAFFSFMGGLIVSRYMWFKTPLCCDPSIKNWAHITRLLSLTSEAFKLLYTPRLLLNRRGGNDSFSKHGMLERLKLQIVGLQSSVECASCDSIVKKNLIRVIKKEVYPNWYNAVKEDLKSNNAPKNAFDELTRIIQPLMGNINGQI